VQATFNDGYGTKNFHKFADYPVNTARYHILRLTVNADNNSTLSIDSLPSQKKITHSQADRQRRQQLNAIYRQPA